MSRRFQSRHRNIFLVTTTAFVSGIVAALYLLGGLRWVFPPAAPRVGETATAVIERLGPPDFDSRTDEDSDCDFQLGYALGLGTRHHLHVRDGKVVEITYSSR